MKALHERENTEKLTWATADDPRLDAENEVQVGDFWTPPVGVSLGAGAIIGGRVYRLTVDVAAGNYDDYEAIQDYNNLINIPASFPPDMHTLDWHTGSLNITRIDGHTLRNKVHIQILAGALLRRSRKLVVG